MEVLFAAIRRDILLDVWRVLPPSQTAVEVEMANRLWGRVTGDDGELTVLVASVAGAI